MVRVGLSEIILILMTTMGYSITSNIRNGKPGIKQVVDVAHGGFQSLFQLRILKGIEICSSQNCNYRYQTCLI